MVLLLIDKRIFNRLFIISIYKEYTSSTIWMTFLLPYGDDTFDSTKDRIPYVHEKNCQFHLNALKAGTKSHCHFVFHTQTYDMTSGYVVS